MGAWGCRSDSRVIPELLVGGCVFVDEDDVARAESEGEGVEADGGLAFRGDGTGGVFRVMGRLSQCCFQGVSHGRLPCGWIWILGMG